MQIIDKTKELAEAIRNSDELKAVKLGEIAILNDPEAKKLMDEYQEIQNIAQEKSYEELSPELKERVDKLEEKMSSNQLIGKYMEAQTTLDRILNSINIMINNALTEQEGSCSSCSSCSSCAGCSTSN